MYGGRAACRQRCSAQQSAEHGEDDPFPTRESIEPELQVDLFYLFGQAFLLRVSDVLVNLIMMTHLSSLWGYLTALKYSGGMLARISTACTLVALDESIHTVGFGCPRHVVCVLQPCWQAARPPYMPCSRIRVCLLAWDAAATTWTVDLLFLSPYLILFLSLSYLVLPFLVLPHLIISSSQHTVHSPFSSKSCRFLSLPSLRITSPYFIRRSFTRHSSLLPTRLSLTLLSSLPFLTPTPGLSIAPLSASDRKEVMSISHRWFLEDFDVVAFAYTPVHNHVSLQLRYTVFKNVL